MSSVGADVASLASTEWRSKREIREEKARRRAERLDRTLHVKLMKRVDKNTLETLLKNAHSGIEHVCLPRRSRPKFAFIFCKDEKIRDDVRKAIKQIKDEKIGHVIVRNSIPQREEVKAPKEVMRKSIDPQTLVLEMIPKDLSIQDIEAEFPKCKKVSRFNPRRVYVYFRTAEDGLEAFQQLEKNKLCGHKIRPKFRMVNCKKSRKNKDLADSLLKATGDKKDAESESDEDASDDQDNSNSDDGSISE